MNLVTTSPLTINRAATALVRSRIHLEGAEEELRLALRIVTEGPLDSAPLDASERLALMQRLEEYLGRLSALREMSGAVWDRGPSWRADSASNGDAGETRA